MELSAIIQSLKLEEMTGWAVMLLVTLLSLIQISPIKLNPWDAILHWLGKKLNGSTERKLKDLERRVQSQEKQIQDMWINSHRNAILNFARETRAGIDHDSEEWANCLNQCAAYENHVLKSGIPNGVVQVNIAYLRDLFMKLSSEHRL